MSELSTLDYLRSELRPIEAQRAFARHVATDPVHIGLLTFPLVLALSGAIVPEFARLNYLQNSAIYLGRIVIYLASVALIYPYLLRALMPRGVPLALLIYIYYLFAAIVSVYTTQFLFGQYTDTPPIIRILRAAVVAVPFWLFYVNYITPRYKAAIFNHVIAGGIWLPPITCTAQKRAEFNVNGDKILWMKADSPHVKIYTDNGEKIIRCTFNDALDLTKDQDGERIHRSYWVHNDIMASIKYVNGNPRLMTTAGDAFPMSRAAAHKLAERLK